MNEAQGTKEALSILRSPHTVRERCGEIFSLAQRNELKHFTFSENALTETGDYVARVIKNNYPKLNIPYHSRWQHFTVGGVARVAELDKKIKDKRELAKTKFDLGIISVLLDAGAGMSWQYMEAATQKAFSRSEGLAVASFEMFTRGTFAENKAKPWQVDGTALRKLDVPTLAAGMQVSKDNPLTGLEGRVDLLKRLGESLVAQPKIFGTEARLGNLFDFICSKAEGKAIGADVVLETILECFSRIWPSRFMLGKENLGDVWKHSAIKTNDLTDGFVPFHKLSQWLTYSLFEPLEEVGFTITEMGAMTGLSEYRNGGLYVDRGVITPRETKAFSQVFKPDDEFVVEWRALTVALLDKTADLVRSKFNLTPEEFPLAKVLQGGTWYAGRLIAQEKRKDGGPPFRIESDGTLF